MNSTDPMELEVAQILNALGIKFIHESNGKNQRLDFYLPDHDVYIEVKKFPSERTGDQMSLHENIILIQGRKSLKLLNSLLT